MARVCLERQIFLRLGRNKYLPLGVHALLFGICMMEEIMYCQVVCFS